MATPVIQRKQGTSANAGSSTMSGFLLPSSIVNPFLAVYVACASRSVSSVVWKPDPGNAGLNQNMVRSVARAVSSVTSVEMFHLVNPTAAVVGGGQIVVTLSASTRHAWEAVSFSDVDQVIPTTDVQGAATGTGGTVSLTLNSRVGDLVVLHSSRNSADHPAVVAPEVEEWYSLQASNVHDWGQSQPGAAPTVTASAVYAGSSQQALQAHSIRGAGNSDTIGGGAFYTYIIG